MKAEIARDALTRAEKQLRDAADGVSGGAVRGQFGCSRLLPVGEL